MNSFSKTFAGLLIGICTQISVFAQTSWPKEIALDSGGRILLYQIQPEALSGNQLTARAAFSARKQNQDEPVFGAVWFKATLNTDAGKPVAILEDIQVTEVKIADAEDEPQIDKLRQLVQREVQKTKLEVALDELNATLETASTGPVDFRNDPPEIIYTQHRATLVLIDGEPFLTPDEQLKLNRVRNTPFLLVQQPNEPLYYLYANHVWYQSTSIKSGWMPAVKFPREVKKLRRKIRNQENQGAVVLFSNGWADPPTLPSVIIVRTSPAELIQTEGEPAFSPLDNTKLLYVTNTNDNIFLDIASQSYYVVLTGRWYKAPQLKGPWTYVPAEALPTDFARIPKGSPKEDVLAYVPGTEVAREAVRDAQIPQTAKVDRKKAGCEVSYDGDPQFELIAGTNLYLASNASATVLRANNRYYCVENGVWFVSNQATGPWTVATERPTDVIRIPPGNPAYMVRYVYIYDITPDFVYMGYTAGYTGCYVYGRTIVYGTGYHYPAWYGRVYYPRPTTWGFGLYYDRWTGWNFGFSLGWVNFLVPRTRHWSWWGPSIYRPAYRRGPTVANYDYPDRRTRASQPYLRGAGTTNLYQYRSDVLTSRGPGNYGPVPENTSRHSLSLSELFRKGRPANEGTDDAYSNRSGTRFERERSANRPQIQNPDWKPTNRGNTTPLPSDKPGITIGGRSAGRANSQPQSSPAPSSKPSPQIRKRGPQ